MKILLPLLATLLAPGLAFASPNADSQVLTAYTGNHQFLVKLKNVPKDIPFEQYFGVSIEAFDGKHPSVLLKSPKLSLKAGMKHGRKVGFAHGMESSPKIDLKQGLAKVSGLFFHMRGPWTLDVTVTDKGQSGTAEFTLPCCGQ